VCLYSYEAISISMHVFIDFITIDSGGFQEWPSRCIGALNEEE
jgi:hypothetical protein